MRSNIGSLPLHFGYQIDFIASKIGATLTMRIDIETNTIFFAAIHSIITYGIAFHHVIYFTIYIYRLRSESCRAIEMHEKQRNLSYSPSARIYCSGYSGLLDTHNNRIKRE